VHLVGGLTGTVLIGLFATDGNNAWYPDGAVNGLFYGGGFTQLATQVIVAVAAMVFSAAATFVIGVVLRATIGLRVSDEVEINGVDQAVHGETAYETLGGSRRLGTVDGPVGTGDTTTRIPGDSRVTTEAK
jgi:Amt family ammonium transporter